MKIHNNNIKLKGTVLPPDFVLVVPSETLLREDHPLSEEKKKNFMILYQGSIFVFGILYLFQDFIFVFRISYLFSVFFNVLV